MEGNHPRTTRSRVWKKPRIVRTGVVYRAPERDIPLFQNILQHVPTLTSSHSADGSNGVRLRSMLKTLLEDPDMAHSLGQNAQKTIREKYNITQFTENWNNLFYSTIEKYKE